MPLPITFWAREDSGTANNPSVNLTGADAVQITFVAETSSGGAGDLFLDQPAGGGVDPDTQVEIDGTSYSFTYELVGILPTLKKDGAGQVPDQFEGSEIIIITVQDYPTAGDTTRFVFLPDEEATAAEMNAFGNGAISVQNTDETPPPNPICFVSGTRLQTPEGEIRVEDLRIGDPVLTADHGAQPIRWIGSSSYKWSQLADPDKPVLIAAGALEPGLPQRDVMVSPQHKLLMRGWRAEALFGEPEVLAPARGLTGLPGVRVMSGKRCCTYIHIMLARHGLLSTQGLLSESFYPGRAALKMLATRQRREILARFPALKSDPANGYGPTARLCLTMREAQVLADAMRGEGRTGAGRPPAQRNGALAGQSAAAEPAETRDALSASA